MITTLLWDNDGILVDTEMLYFIATRDVLATVGIELTEALYRELFLIEGRGAWHLVTERGFSRADVERLRDDRNARYAEALTEAPLLIDGVADVLTELGARFRMGIVTSSRRDHFDVIHARTGILGHFDFVLTAADVRHVKPDPELYRRAVELSGGAAHHCLAIEDSERGLLAALGAGVHCAIVPSQLTRGTAFSGAAAVLDSIRDIPAWLDGSAMMVTRS
jgi:HAD superfamily hydrolase (TIGR01509 family)